MDKPAPLARILVVEDETLTGLSLEHMLLDAGYLVVAVAVSAQEALLSVQLSKPDLVLMDVCVRGTMDGVDAARQIQEETKLPVIFVTGTADAETLKRARTAKPFGYIVKPISQPSLLSAIEIALYKNRADCEEADQRQWATTLLDAIPQALIVTDLDGIVTFFNKKAARLTGLTAKTIVGKHIAEFIHLRNKRGEDVTLQLLDQITRDSEATLPLGTTLSRWDCTTNTPVEGNGLTNFIKGAPTGILLSLHEAASKPAQPVAATSDARQALVVRVLWTIGRGLLAIGKLHF